MAAAAYYVVVAALAVSEHQQTRAKGKMEKGEAEVGAAQEETAAASREADRKSALSRAIASQNASGGARGVGLTGSVMSVMKEDMRREAEDTQRDQFMTGLRADAMRKKGDIAMKQAGINATMGLLGTAASMMAAAPSGGDTNTYGNISGYGPNAKANAGGQFTSSNFVGPKQ